MPSPSNPPFCSSPITSEIPGDSTRYMQLAVNTVVTPSEVHADGAIIGPLRLSPAVRSTTVAARLRLSVRPEQPRPLLHVAGERDQLVRFSDQDAAIAVAIEVNGVGTTTTPCGEGCTVYGPGTPAPVMTWIHAGAHTFPRGTAERLVSFFRDHSRTR
mgnify:CR=1 FL=1